MPSRGLNRGRRFAKRPRATTTSNQEVQEYLRACHHGLDCQESAKPIIPGSQLSADHGWLIASFLHDGEPVLQADGHTATVVAIRSVPGAADMWDLTVSQVHDFAVGNGAYVVHNCGGDIPSGYGEAHGADNAGNLQKYADYANKYGDPRELPDGRIRFYGEETPPRTPGRITGNRYVKEWDPATGRTRGWMESYEADGSVRQVHPKDIDGVYIGDDTPHYLFDHGSFEGKW